MKVKQLVFLQLILFVLFIPVLNAQTFDNPLDCKKFWAEQRLSGSDKIQKVIVKDPDNWRPKNYTEVLAENDYDTRGVNPPARQLPETAMDYAYLIPPEPGPSINVGPKVMRAREDIFDEPASIMEFETDQLVSIPSTPAQRQPSIATGEDGTIYAVWGEGHSGGNRIMFSKSTDEGETWTESIVVDDVGTNYYPRIAVHGSGGSARIHVVYAYTDVHYYDIYDTTGTWVRTDTSTEGDVYYTRSMNGGLSFGGYQAISNRDIDLIVVHFEYDESMPDIHVDDDNNVFVSYHTQADEGHVMMVAIWLIWLIVSGELPPGLIEYTWYKVCYKVSTNGGSTFSGQENVVNDWLVDRTRGACGLNGSGGDATGFVSYSCTGFLSLASSSIEMRRISNPFFGGSVGGDETVDDGYCIPGCLVVDDENNPKIGYTKAWTASDYDVYYNYSLDEGSSFEDAIIVDISTADCYEPRLAIDEANNPFLTWTDRTRGNYDISCCWSEDGGLTLRPDHIKVNQTPGSLPQYWPTPSLHLTDEIRRLDVDWWDTHYDTNGDIYYNGTKWWRTDINIVLNDTLANPMGGTLTLSYTSYGVVINREITTGQYIVYHDSLTEITLDQMSSGSTSEERWIWDDHGDWSFTPTSPGIDTTIVYFDQYWTTFTAESGNPPACSEEIPDGIGFTYEYFSGIEVASTLTEDWADVRGNYNYASPYPPAAEEERWYCPEPAGMVLDPIVSPVYYYQYAAMFLKPERLNPECCPHDVPEFDITTLYFAGENVGGETPFRDWVDCGSEYEYENPKNITATERWLVTDGANGVIGGIGPYEPGAYKQYRPTINLVGPSCSDPINTVYTTQHWNGGVEDLISGLCGAVQLWTDCGSDLEFSQFTTLGWVNSTPRAFPCVTSAFTGMVRYGNVVMATLENDFGYGFIVSDTDTHSAPYIAGWAPASDHEICAVSPQVFDYTRYVFDHWSDGGALCHTVSSVTDTSFTAFYNREHRLQVISEHGTAWGDGWYGEGTDVEFGVNSIDSTSGGGIRYIFEGWDGSGSGSYDGTDTSHTVEMENPIIEEAEWTTEYRVLMEYESCAIEPTMTGGGWHAAGSFPAIATDSILGGTAPEDSSRCVFDHWESTPSGAAFANINHAHTTVILDRPYTLTAVYVAQHKLWISHADDTISAPTDPTVGWHWVTEGDTVVAWATNPWGPNYCVGYIGNGSVSDGSADTVEFVLEEPSSIEWQWGTQYTLTVGDTTDTDWILTVTGATPPAGEHFYIPGSSVVATVGSEFAPLGGSMRLHCVGYRGTGSVSDDTELAVSFTIDENTTIEWLFVLEYKLTIDDEIYSPYSASPHLDSPEPAYGDHWYREGTEITCSIDDHSGPYVIVGYAGSGSAPTGWGGASVTFTITNGSTLTWRWMDEASTAQLEVISEHGTCVPPVGINYFPPGIMISCYTDFIAMDPSGDSRYRCVGWSGTGVVPAMGFSNATGLFTLTGSGLVGTITWNWMTEHKLEIISEYGDSLFPIVGEHWFAEGTMVPIYCDPIDTIVAPDSIMFCTGFHPEGHSLDGIDTTSTEFSFVLLDPSVIEWRWTGYRIPLIINSEWGDPSPSDTTYWLPGTEIVALVTSPYYDGLADGERYNCTGWTATGSAPATGSLPTVIFSITDTTVITWNWDHQYRLTINSWPEEYGSPGPPLGEHWYNEGVLVNGSVTVPDDTMYCIGFEGTGSAPATSHYPEFSFTIDEPSSVTWLWYGEGSVAELFVRSEFGSPEPYGRTWWLLGTEVDANVDESVTVGPDIFSCVGWRGEGSCPLAGDSNHVVFTIDEDTYIEWGWGNLYQFTITNPGDYGTPSPVPGLYEYEGGTYISGNMTNHPYWTGTDTMYCVGYHGSGDLPAFDPHTDFDFTITEHSTLEWQWSSEAVRLTVNSFYGAPWPHGVTYWIPSTSVEAWADESFMGGETYVDVSDGVRAECAGWTGTGSCPAVGAGATITFNITENSTITWDWVLTYRLTIINEDDWGDPLPSAGDWWYRSGTTVEGALTENPSGPADTMYCVGYYGTGDLPEVSPQTDFSFEITQPCSLEWRWYGESMVRQLIVISPWDSPEPYGTTYWLIGSEITAVIDSMVPVGADSSSWHRCLGYELTHGETISIDSTYEVVWEITEHSTLEWMWEDQVLITLLEDGAPIEPDFEGYGWHTVGDTVIIYAETPLYHDGSYWGFVNWSTESHTPIEDTWMSHTQIIVEESCTIWAHYAPAVYVVVQKDPEYNDNGFIRIDHEIHDSTAFIATWWGNGSYHDVGVPTHDSTVVTDGTSGISYVTERFNFDRWSDAGDTLHRVGPITCDTTLTAFYETQLMTLINNNPPHNDWRLEVDGVIHADTSAFLLWWSPESVHEIGCTQYNVSGDSLRYTFDSWSDGGARYHETDPTAGPAYYTANYEQQMRVRILKDPSHADGGYIQFDDSVTYDVPYLDFWIEDSTNHTIAVSEYDIDTTVSPEQVHHFTRWSDDGALSHETGYLTSAQNYTAYYETENAILSFEVSVGGATSYDWDVDSISIEETRTMTSAEVFMIENTGNTPIDFGLNIEDVSLAAWTPGYITGENRFVVRAQFNDATSTPAVFSLSRDYIKSEMTWATEGSYGIFGEGGVNIRPFEDYPDTDGTERLWMQFVAPIWSDFFDVRVDVEVVITGKYHLY